MSNIWEDVSPVPIVLMPVGELLKSSMKSWMKQCPVWVERLGTPLVD